MTKISIIIPILNEAKTIGKLLQYLLENIHNKAAIEIIIVDGGSTDESLQEINKVTSNFSIISQTSLEGTQPKVSVLHSEKGRAKQMNYGAKHAKGQILYFLHADSFPPKNFDQLILNEVHQGNLAGCFRMQFDSNHWWLKLASWFTQFSWRACRGGDQSQFITRELFEDIGGYDENYIIYEDNVLINELYSRHQFVVINKKIRTSARLYKKHGVWTLQYYFWSIYVKKWFGASADDLYAYYKKHIH
ncbi:MAG: TIGR04283 family arsenosugar biosynthesis glycosyltransferase [Psychroserpens sp.]|nr:TIGR04283 family arsenosugar biosynthesis glycosyltransferase [Psychroserpens sp.]